MSIVTLDLETTGTDSRTDAIIEVALVRIDTSGTLETFTSFVNPGFPVPPEITAITGITPADLANAPVFSKIRQRIVDFIGDSVVMGHNVDFDIAFLREYGITLGMDHPRIDTFFLAQILYSHEKSLNLGYLAESFGYTPTGTHRALADVETTIWLFRHMGESIAALDPDHRCLLDFILQYRGGRHSVGYTYDFFGFSRENLPTADAVRDTILGKMPPPSPTILHHHRSTTVTTDDMLASIRERLGLEGRPEQERLLHDIDESFVAGKRLLCEAPTGIGKTFAYLLPAIHHSIATGEQVHISTHTRLLQDQIVAKDLPRIADTCDILGIPFSYAKLKGKSNYLSLALFFPILEGELMEEYEITCVTKILFWLLETSDGDMDDISLWNRDGQFVDRFRSVPRYVTSPENPYKKEEFLVRARKRAADANIVVINHALLRFEADNIHTLVVDEAHTLEDVMTEGLRASLSPFLIDGAFTTLEGAITRYQKSPAGRATGGRILPDLPETRDTIHFHLGVLFDFLGAYFRDLTLSKAPETRDILVRNDLRTRPDYAHIRTTADLLIDTLRGFVARAFQIPEALFSQVDYIIEEFESFASVIERCLVLADNTIIPIMAKRSDRAEYTLSFVPFHTGQYLREHLWEKLKVCILTSATLTTSGSFVYLTGRLSCEAFDTRSYQSDFDYSRQALLFLPTDIPDVRETARAHEVYRFIGDVAGAYGGKTLALFTSFRAIREAYLVVEPVLRACGITLLAQGVSGGKNRILEMLRRDPSHTVVFGTDSFWQGVDIPGEALEILIVMKFPFAVPTDPVIQARSGQYSDAFDQYSVPSMVLKLRQGFGRLIRTRDDRGIILLLDNRIHTAWGERVKADFPPNIRVRSGSRESFLGVVREIRKEKSI